MAKRTKRRAARPAKPGTKPASRALAILLAILLALPMASAAIAACAGGIRLLADRAAGLEGDAEWLRDLLSDAGCPPDAAKSIALRMDKDGLLPVLGVYYIPEDGDPSTGSAVMTTQRHMVSAAVQDGRLYVLQVTDPYQNQSVLMNAGMPPDDAVSATDYLETIDAGLLSDASQGDDGTFLLALPDGEASLSKTDGEWSLRYTAKEGEPNG